MKGIWFVVAAFAIVALAPVASATPVVAGSASTCTAETTCTYALSNSNGTGWATTTFNSLSFKLPGESNATTGIPYTWGALLGTNNVYHVTGSFTGMDVNNGKAVYGSTDGNVSISVACSRGCTTTFKFINGSIEIHATTADWTKTAVSCSPSSFVAGHSTACTASVSDLGNKSAVPTGKVLFTSSVGHFAKRGSCTLVAGNCSLRLSPGDEAVGTFWVDASYQGVGSYYTSLATTLIYVSSGGG